MMRSHLKKVIAAAFAVAIPSIALADVAFIAILTVQQNNQEAFDALAKRMVSAASENDGVLIYEFARAGDRVYGYERYVDTAAHGRHEAIIAPFLEELTSLASFETIVTLSELTADHQAAFEAIGSEIGQPIASFARGQ
ncbi:MAG: hypothetical protein JXR15_16385 [Shimia sp.]|uniref:putative quinol monooxygenase n=1 Tax=Shimia sp. TaxID=1954381 RepID=UPI003B8CAE36